MLVLDKCTESWCAQTEPCPWRMQGTLRVGRYNTFEGWVSSESVGQDILISGRVDMNRALDGDSVVVELLPESQWRAPAKSLPTGAAAKAGDDGEGEEDDAEGGHIAQVRDRGKRETLSSQLSAGCRALRVNC